MFDEWINGVPRNVGVNENVMINTAGDSLPPSLSKLSMGEAQSRNDPQGKIRNINEILECLGMENIPDSSCFTSPAHAEAVIKVIGTLLSSASSASVSSNASLSTSAAASEDQFFRMKSHCTRIENQLARTKEKLDYSRRETQQQRFLVEQAENEKKKSSELAQSLKETISKLKSNFAYKQKLFEHEANKKEKQLVKMKDKMHAMYQQKDSEKQMGIEIANAVSRVGGGKRKTWDCSGGARDQADIYRILISNYEEKQAQQLEENQLLRRSLYDMQVELIGLVNTLQEGIVLSQEPRNEVTVSNEGVESEEGKGMTDEEDGSSKRGVHGAGIGRGKKPGLDDGDVYALPSNYFEMPFDMVKANIEETMKEKWDLVKELTALQMPLITNSASSAPGSRRASSDRKGAVSLDNSFNKEEQVNALLAEIESYKNIIQSQEQLLQTYLQTPMGGGPDDDCKVEGGAFRLDDSTIMSEVQQLEHDKRSLLAKQKTFEEERARYTEAAVGLAQERGLLQKQKKMLEEERRNFYNLQQRFLSQSSPAVSTSSPLLGGFRLDSMFESPGKKKPLSPIPMSKLDGEKVSGVERRKGSVERTQSPRASQIRNAARKEPCCLSSSFSSVYLNDGGLATTSPQSKMNRGKIHGDISPPPRDLVSALFVEETSQTKEGQDMSLRPLPAISRGVGSGEE
eukprot:Nk52_evm14s271 gene=Nk52_evmTU14s271